MACLGGDVELALLEVTSGWSPTTLEERLAPPLEEGLLAVSPGGGDLAVRFHNDRAQHGAYGRLGRDRRQALQLSMARRLATRLALGGAEQRQPQVRSPSTTGRVPLGPPPRGDASARSRRDAAAGGILAATTFGRYRLSCHPW
jgi:hypothetical protein